MLKLVFALFGFLSFSWVGALLGWFAGSFLQRYLDYGRSGVNPLTAKQRQQVFFETLFKLAGSLAKADGRVSAEEVRQMEGLIANLEMIPEMRREAINYFRQGTQGSVDLRATLAEFMQVCGHTRNLRQMLLFYLINLALADDYLDSRELKMLRNIAVSIGFRVEDLDYMLRVYKQQYSSETPVETSQAQLQKAYKTLGVDEGINDQALKKTYRKLMSQFHPDKLMGQGVPSDMIKMATKKSQQIQAAYDLIKEQRRLN